MGPFWQSNGAFKGALKYLNISLVMGSLWFFACKTSSSMSPAASDVDAAACNESSPGEKIYQCDPGWMEGEDCLFCPSGYDYHAAFKTCYNGLKVESISAVRNDLKKLLGCKNSVTVPTTITCDDVIREVCGGQRQICSCTPRDPDKPTAMRFNHCKSYKVWDHTQGQFVVTDVEGLMVPGHKRGTYSREEVLRQVLPGILRTIVSESEGLKSGRLKPGQATIRCDGG